MIKALASKDRFNRISDEQEEKMEQILAVDNPSWDRASRGFYYIDVTGKYGVYFTLWRYMPSKSPYAKEFQYITNLSIDPIEAAQKARTICGNVPVEIDACGNYQGLQGKKLVFTFGKYRGVHFGEVFATNPKYFVFLNKLIKDGEMRKMTAENVEMIHYFTELYFETLAKNNRENITSAFVGAVGDTFNNVKLTVTHVNRNPDYTTVKLMDEAGNRYMTYKLPYTTEVNDVVEPLSFKVLEHKEMVGINYTKIGYFKFPKK